MHAKRTIAALATALAATGVAVGSGATFTSHSANAANTFASGTLTHSDSVNGAILTGANMKPGDSKTGDVTIKNTGSIAGTFNLTETHVTNNFGSGDLKLRIQDITNTAAPTDVYNGELGKIASTGITLGSFAAGEAHTYRYTVTLDASAPNTDQGKTATADYEFDATQS